MRKPAVAFRLTLAVLIFGYVGMGEAGSQNTDFHVSIVRSCERQDDSACVTKKYEQALIESSSLSPEEKLLISYELAARYEYYDGDLKKARQMYLDIEKIDPKHGITGLCIKRLNRLISGLAKR